MFFLFSFKQVGFFGTTLLFVLITTAFIKIQERVEKNKGYSKTLGETIYFQFEYVLTIIAIHGKFVVTIIKNLVNKLN